MLSDPATFYIALLSTEGLPQLNLFLMFCFILFFVLLLLYYTVMTIRPSHIC